jgi:peroxiredoxin
MPSRWPSVVLKVAGVYNLLWGAWVILFPNHLFDWTGIARPNYPGIWQCVGMIVGVYGIGYWIAARDFIRHWPIVLVGFLGKILGPIGFVQSALTGVLPWSWGATIITNDLIWWVPFGAMLYLALNFYSNPDNRISSPTAVSSGSDGPSSNTTTPQEANRTALTSHGKTIEQLSENQNVLVLFLRHSGCTFCREALGELKARMPELQRKGIQPILVHMGSMEDGKKMLDRADLADVPHLSDPNCDLYKSYGLQRGVASQLFGPSVWWRGFQAAILSGYGIGKLNGDGFQLGGSFLVKNGKIHQAFPAKDAADKIPFECLLQNS